jgi:hypothetical protein
MCNLSLPSGMGSSAIRICAQIGLGFIWRLPRHYNTIQRLEMKYVQEINLNMKVADPRVFFFIKTIALTVIGH